MAPAGRTGDGESHGGGRRLREVARVTEVGSGGGATTGCACCDVLAGKKEGVTKRCMGAGS